MSTKWHFPSTDGGEDDGFHDSLRETFEGDHESYVARETIQNSIDARLDYDEPVQVQFDRLTIPTDRLPGASEFLDALSRAREYVQGQEGAVEYYDSALELLKKPLIPVLKISDLNTSGLNGDDENTAGEWYRLIRAVGASSMSGVGGGSFGIGKGGTVRRVRT